MNANRLIAEDDTYEFCLQVTDALAKGWELYGGPAYGFDAGTGKMRCAHAEVKELVGDYSPDMKLGQL